MSEYAVKEKHPLIQKFNAGRFKALDLSLVLCVLLCICLPLFPRPEFQVPGWAALLGRLHPLLVHFPLALIPLIFLFELLYRDRPVAAWPQIKRVLWCTALLTAVASAVVGYFLYGSGDYGGDLFTEHFKGGSYPTAFIGITAYLGIRLPARPSKNKVYLYRGMLAVSLLGVIYTGHHGGSLTHGEAFITEAMPFSAPENFVDKPRAELLVYGDLIAPILEQRCVSCHNANKIKGGLQLTTLPLMLAGGDSDQPTLSPHAPDNSLLYHRISLPATHDDRMPPEGKSMLSNTEIDLISWWIEEGATEEQLFGSGPADSLRAHPIQRLADSQINLRRRRARKQMEIGKLIESLAPEIPTLLIAPDPATNNTSLAVSMHIPPRPVDDNTISNLISQTDQITSLSLAGSDITDDALYHISQLPDLSSLYLTYTAIEGSGLTYLRDLPALGTLSLSGTGLQNEHIINLSQMPALEAVYLHDVPVDSMVIVALQGFMPAVNISLEVGPLNQVISDK